MMGLPDEVVRRKDEHRCSDRTLALQLAGPTRAFRLRSVQHARAGPEALQIGAESWGILRGNKASTARKIATLPP